MNERLKELIKQHGVNITIDRLGYGEGNVEGLAELIVRECVAVVDGMADPEDSERYFWAIQNASHKIKQHFGVEE